jgi:hypothetical protein
MSHHRQINSSTAAEELDALNVAEILDAGPRLGRMLYPMSQGLGHLVEINIAAGHALVIGAYRFAGYVDYKAKLLKSFSSKDMSDHAHFDQAYRALVDQHGYRLENTNQPELIMGNSRGYYEFLSSTNVLPALRKIFSGQVTPVAGVVNQDLAGIKKPFTTASRIVAPVDWTAARAKDSASPDIII